MRYLQSKEFEGEVTLSCQSCGGTDISALDREAWFATFSCNACGADHEVMYDMDGTNPQAIKWNPGEEMKDMPASAAEDLKRLALRTVIILALALLLTACLKPPVAPPEPSSQRIEGEAVDTCQPPICYPDIRPPGGPK
jgi:hypothetical protein